MERNATSNKSPLTMWANSSTSIYAKPIDKSQEELSPFSGGASLPAAVAQANSGYAFKIVGEQQDCYHVEMWSGKVGYVLKSKLVPNADLKQREAISAGMRVLCTSKMSSQAVFVVDSEHTGGIYIFEEPDAGSKQLFVLGPGEAILILEELDWYYRIWLPGTSQGFVSRNDGVRREVMPREDSPYGFYGIRKDKWKTVEVRYAPNLTAEIIMNLDSTLRLPIVEEWDNWFKVQLPDNSLGFVPEAYGTRSVFPDTLLDKPSEGSGSMLGSMLKVAGVLALGTVAAALKGSSED